MKQKFQNDLNKNNRTTKISTEKPKKQVFKSKILWVPLRYLVEPFFIKFTVHQELVDKIRRH